MYDAYQQRITECDRALEQHLKSIADKPADAPPTDPEFSQTASVETPRRPQPKRRRKAGSHAPQFDVGRELHRI